MPLYAVLISTELARIMIGVPHYQLRTGGDKLSTQDEQLQLESAVCTTMRSVHSTGSMLLQDRLYDAVLAPAGYVLVCASMHQCYSSIEFFLHKSASSTNQITDDTNVNTTAVIPESKRLHWS